LHQELELLVSSGLTPAAALQAATIHNARALHQANNLGSIEAGKLADMVILDANPLADIRNTRRIFRVVRGGIICSPETLLQASPRE
jgi:imidazolonepropionase-like amidohydrolase